MGIIRPVVQAFVGTALNTWHDLAFGGIIGAKLSASMSSTIRKLNGKRK